MEAANHNSSIEKKVKNSKIFFIVLDIDDHNVLFSLLLRHTSKTSNQKFK